MSDINNVSGFTVLNNNEQVVETTVVKQDVVAQQNQPLTQTSLEQLRSYVGGALVELPPFAEGQPLVARMRRPSLLGLLKSGRIPNSLLNQATSLFVNGSDSLNSKQTNIKDLMDIIEVIADTALISPTLEEIRSVGLELSDDQLTAIFSYSQQGVSALGNFRTK